MRGEDEEKLRRGKAFKLGEIGCCCGVVWNKAVANVESKGSKCIRSAFMLFTGTTSGCTLSRERWHQDQRMVS